MRKKIDATVRAVVGEVFKAVREKILEKVNSYFYLRKLELTRAVIRSVEFKK